MSMEFLMGRALGNNLINLTAYKEVREALDEIGLDLECDRGSGAGSGTRKRRSGKTGCLLPGFPRNTRISRLTAAASVIATVCSSRRLRTAYQVEVPDNWLKNGYPFELHRPEYAYEVKFGGHVRTESREDGSLRFVQEDYQSVLAIPYDMPVVGYGNNVVNTLMIWDAERQRIISSWIPLIREIIRRRSSRRIWQEIWWKCFTRTTIMYAGKELRLKQQYFFVSASVQRALARYKKNHDDIRRLPEKVTFQLNDTHPTVTVAELMRILVDEEGLGWDEAWEITTKTCAYTNHTIMAEALEKWPIEMFSAAASENLPDRG